MEEWCTIGVLRGPLTQITSFAGYIYLSCFSQWSLSHLGMSSVLQRRKNQNYLENGLGPLWFVQQCTLKSLRPNPAMPQPCIMRSYFDFCFWSCGTLVIHNISLLFGCGKERYDDPYGDEPDGFDVKRRIEVIIWETNSKDETNEEEDWGNYERDQQQRPSRSFWSLVGRALCPSRSGGMDTFSQTSFLDMIGMQQKSFHIIGSCSRQNGIWAL